MNKRKILIICCAVLLILLCVSAAWIMSMTKEKKSMTQNFSKIEAPKKMQKEKETQNKSNGRIIVLDPGHGKSTSLMSDEEKLSAGLVQNSRGAWGEWRHYKIGSSTVDCEGSGCNGRVTPTGACWYPCGDGDRNIEPELNLNNAISAKKHLEKMGYTVRLTRTTNDEYLSMSKKLAFCHPNNDRSLPPDADAFICIHSNAANGSAKGSAYISLEGEYDQKWIDESYVEKSNTLGRLCNENIVKASSLDVWGDGVLGSQPELIAFCKSPVPCGYLEIGFYDTPSELEILKKESDRIGEGIAKGVDEYFRTLEK